jgi:hypothetical protein
VKALEDELGEEKSEVVRLQLEKDEKEKVSSPPSPPPPLDVFSNLKVLILEHQVVGPEVQRFGSESCA